MIITIPNTPPTINKYIGRTNIWQYQEDKKRYNQIFKLATLKDRLKEPLDGCEIVVTYCFKDNKRRDPSNYDKFLLDSLVDCGYIKDDNYKVIKEFTTKAIVNKEEKTIIEIKEVC